MKKFLLTALLGFVIVGCENNTAHTTKATAELKSAQGQNVSGLVTFEETAGGVKVVADIKGLKPGLHGFHIHENGDCSAPDFASVGAHYNPTNKKHGAPNSPEHHVGDLGNVVADTTGTAHFEVTSTELKLNGEHSIVGRSIVVHSDADDFVSQPAGNSGDKIGCGVINAVVTEVVKK